MNDRLRQNDQSQRHQQAGGGSPDDADGSLADLRAVADRLLGIADDAFEHVRAADSLEHLNRHRQRGGQ